MVRGCRLMEKGQLPKGQKLEVTLCQEKKKKLKNKQKSCKAGVWEYQKGGRVAREKEKFYLFTSCFH